MKGINVIGSLLLTALVVNGSSYVAKEEQKNAFLSDEAVASYFRNKFEIEKVKPAMVMEYLIKLMGSSKKPIPGGDTTKDVTCVAEGTQYSLKKSQLEMILNTVYSQTGGQVHTTLITPDQGKDMYTDEVKPLGAYQVMISTVGQPSNIWANYSPCPDCVRALIKNYEKSTNKPTVHIAKIYTKSSQFSDTVEALQCLAKLKHVGFSLVEWNFVEFKTVISDSTCKEEINERLGNNQFTTEHMKLASQLEFVRQISESPHANSWCV